MSRDNFVVAGLIGVLFLYPIAIRMIASAVHPKRIELVQLGNALLRSDDLRVEYKLIVKEMLKDAFDYKEAVRMACGFPVFAFKVATGRIDTSRRMALESDARFKDFVALYAVSIAAANPAFALLFGLEAIFIGLPLAILKIPSDLRTRSTVRRAVLKNINSSSARAKVIELVAEVEVDKRQHHSFAA